MSADNENKKTILIAFPSDEELENIAERIRICLQPLSARDHSLDLNPDEAEHKRLWLDIEILLAGFNALSNIRPFVPKLRAAIDFVNRTDKT